MLPNAQPKPRPKLLDKRQAKADVDRIDKQERTKCRARSGGRCEVRVVRILYDGHPGAIRCTEVVRENHHLIGGIGRRNRGRSILAAHRLDVCTRCHAEITGRVLVPCVTQAKAECAATVRYERIR